MPRKGRRERLEEGIWRDGTGYSVCVSVGSGPTKRTRERRFPPALRIPDDLPYLRAQRAQLEGDFRDELQQHDEQGDRPERGFWPRDVDTYLRRVEPRLQKATYRSRVSELKAWTAIFGDRARHRLRKVDVERAINAWLDATVAAKTIRHRVRTLKHLYAVLDGKRARTPADDVELPKVPKVRPRAVDVKTVRRVIANLIRQERNGRLRDGQTRARFLIRVTTGQRPGQIMATTSADVDFEQRIWWVPPGKGGDPAPLYLNDDMLVAWRLYAATNAWGPFDTTSQARVLRRAGWPADVPIYNARHTVGIAFSERGEELADIQAWMGHRHIQTTRDFYVPRLFSRMKAMSVRADKAVNLNSRLARFLGKPIKANEQNALRLKNSAS